MKKNLFVLMTCLLAMTATMQAEDHVMAATHGSEVSNGQD